MNSKITLLSIVFLLTVSVSAQKLDMDLFKEIKIRNIGPAGMSGRVTAIDVVHKNPDIIYAGTASGGLWKSTGGGVAWKPIFDKEKVASIGALAIVQSNPDVIWAATGEGNPRNSQSSGSGVYKSIDGGVSWKLMGLEGTRNIHRIIVNKDNPNIVLIGAQGSAWGESNDRGVYKTIDGGKSWKKVLFVNNITGIGDMVVDPTNPNKIFAAMWEFRRWPWFFKSGGAGSGLYVTHDAGENWKRLSDEDGLPKGDIGRIGLAIPKSQPQIVYALVESKKNALYKSIDGGVKWNKVTDKNIGGRPFYYGDIAVDPENENRLYNIYSEVSVSEDGGKTFSKLLGWNPTRVHGDYHFWWIHPDDPSFIINGNDGGLGISRDRGTTWRFVENLPVGQFYHVSVDNEIPYNVYGGMQDNGSWRGPSNSLRAGGLRNQYWDEIAFGDGFDVVPDLSDARYAYGMWQGGNLLYIDMETGSNQYIKPIHPENEFLRFNWNAAIAQSPFDNNTVYYGSQYVHKSTDKGQNWEIISPDLTTNDATKQKSNESGGLTFDATGAENFTTILAIAPSPLDDNVIWVSTDDGNVQITRDGGQNWTNITSKIKGLKKGVWLPQIKASKYNVGEAYLVANDYRRNDWTPWLFRTKDYGKSWERVIDETDVSGYVLSFVQDPVEPKLMFTGTEFGLYVSIDAGSNWTKWKGNYPTVSTYDMQIQNRDHDLVIGTFGRSIWILDDIRSLREMAQKGLGILKEKIHVYPAPDAYLFSKRQASGTRFQADAIYKGDDKPSGTSITYSLKATNKEDTTLKSDTVWVQVLNNKSEAIRNMFTVGKVGMNRFNWDLNQKGYRGPNTPKPKKELQDVSGRRVEAGSYSIRLSYLGDTVITSINVKDDPRLNKSTEALAANAAKLDAISEFTIQATEAVDNLNDALKIIGVISEKLNEKKLGNDDLAKSAKALKVKIMSIKEMFVEKGDVQGIIRNPNNVSARLRTAQFYLSAAKQNGTQNLALKFAKSELNLALDTVSKFFNEDWKGYRQEIEKLNLSFFSEY